MSPVVGILVDVADAPYCCCLLMLLILSMIVGILFPNVTLMLGPNSSYTSLTSVMRVSRVSPHFFDVHVTISPRSKSVLYPRLELRFTVPVSYTHLRAHETRHDLVC